MSKVLVLMATYNGEKFLEEQLRTILSQDYQEIDILIRDDGSSDGTLELLQDYCEEYDNIQYYVDTNLGTCKSFFDLMEKAKDNYEYYAFADQDDYWLPQKISRAIEILDAAKSSEPNLYCSNVTLVDENLRKLPSVVRKGEVIPSFGNALIEDICTGCTCVMNHKLFYNIKEHIPRYAIMHDWWFYLVATGFGKIYYDERSFILYRQHQDNVIGAPTNYFNLYIKRLRTYYKRNGNVSRQVMALKEIYSLDDEKRIIIECIIGSKNNFLSRLKIFFSGKIYRQNCADNIILKTIILFKGC